MSLHIKDTKSWQIVTCHKRRPNIVSACTPPVNLHLLFSRFDLEYLEQTLFCSVTDTSCTWFSVSCHRLLGACMQAVLCCMQGATVISHDLSVLCHRYLSCLTCQRRVWRHILSDSESVTYKTVASPTLWRRCSTYRAPTPTDCNVIRIRLSDCAHTPGDANVGD